MDGRHPLVALHVYLPHDEVDVNVHPAKREVRFHHEGSLFSLVQRAVRETLVAESPVPLVSPGAARAGSFRAFAMSAESRQSVAGQGELALGVIPPREGPRASEHTEATTVSNALPALRVLGQAGGTYIIAEGPGGVYLIDQHAAHERIRYEQVVRLAGERQPEVQGLLEPQAVELLPEQVQVVEQWSDTLSAHGFRGEPFGDKTYLLRGVPAGITNTSADRLLMEVLDLLSRAQDPAEAGASLAASIACHGAVRAGDALTHEEMVALVRQLESAVSPQTCPHGRPTMLHLSSNNLEREFGRR